MRQLIIDECGVDTTSKKLHIIGAQSVPGFEAVALGLKVDVKRVTPGIIDLCKRILTDFPKIEAFIFECTELPPYSDAVRSALKKPVFDSITACNFFMSSRQDHFSHF